MLFLLYASREFLSLETADLAGQAWSYWNCCPLRRKADWWSREVWHVSCFKGRSEVRRIRLNCLLSKVISRQVKRHWDCQLLWLYRSQLRFVKLRYRSCLKIAFYFGRKTMSLSSHWWHSKPELLGLGYLLLFRMRRLEELVGWHFSRLDCVLRLLENCCSLPLLSLEGEWLSGGKASSR